jgi:hypothetical protein
VAPPLETAHVGLAAAEGVRRVREALEAGELPDPVDSQWFAGRLKHYEDNAHAGARLDEVLSLVSGPGQPPWWRVERQKKRDRLIRELAATREGNTHARAVWLQGVLRGYQSTSWNRDRVTGTPTAANRVLFDTFSLDADPPTRTWQLARIISGSR